MKRLLFAAQILVALIPCLGQTSTTSFQGAADSVAAAVFPCTDAGIFVAPYVWKPLTNGATPMIEATMPGAYIRTVVQGTASIGILVDGTANVANPTSYMPTIAWTVDAGEFHTVSLTQTNGVYTLPLAAGLDAGKPHQVDLYFRAATLLHARWTQSTAHLRLAGLVLDSGGSLHAPQVRSKRVIAYGDSITEGVGAEGLFTSWAEIGVNNACVTWVPIACEALGCEYGQLGSGGWGMMNASLAIPPLTRSWDKYDEQTSRLVKGLLLPEPDYVLCLMGTNDPENNSRFVTFYVSWLVSMRQACPNARIFCVVPPLGVHQAEIQQVVATRNAAGDLRVHLIDTAPLKYGYRAGQGATKFGYDGVHPSEYGHAVLGAFLAVEAQKVIGSESQKCPPAIAVQPQDMVANIGEEATFTVGVTGTAPLSYQWRFGGREISGATNSSFTVAHARGTNAGFYSVRVTNAYGAAVSSNARLKLNHVPVANAGATPRLVISRNGTDAPVLLDGSRSSDADGDRLHYTWYVEGSTNRLATGVVAPVVLPLGTRVISLVVSDQTASCTNSVSVSVLTPLQAIERIIGMLNKTGTVHPTSLTASLKAARASVDGGNPAAAVSQLGVFQNKVRSQVVPSNPGLAKTCLPLAQQVMDALQGGEAGELEVKVLSVKQETGGAARLSFKGAAGRVHIVEASTNLVDWEVIGAAVERAAGSYEFEDANASNLPGRFYRAKQLAR